jgi:hypothetical protein
MNVYQSLGGRIGAHNRWAAEPDRKAATAPARKGLEARWAREVDPDGVLSPAELAKRIRSKQQAHMQAMALASARARAAKAGAA